MEDQFNTADEEERGLEGEGVRIVTRHPVYAAHRDVYRVKP